jgi:predicted metal-dependent TIM-barrel fold hydrolase
MEFIDLAARTAGRPVDDYLKLALAGCAAVVEPAAIPAGVERGALEERIERLAGIEPRRAARYGIAHYCWLGLAEHEHGAAPELLDLLPKLLDRPTVLGLGGIGFSRFPGARRERLRAQLWLARAGDHLVQLRALRDPFDAAALLDDLRATGVDPRRVIVQAEDEASLEAILRHGLWAELSLAPERPARAARAAALTAARGADRVCIGSGLGLGLDDPLALARFMVEMRCLRHTETAVRAIALDNPRRFLSQSPKFRLYA